MKVCIKCLKRKNRLQFYFRKTGPRKGSSYSKCIDCTKLRGRAYYHTNHERQLKLAKIRNSISRAKKRSFIQKVKDKPCSDCNKRYPHYVMDFDHRANSIKVANVAHTVVRNWSLCKIKLEVAKCDLVCANCHRIRTFSTKKAEVAKVVTAGL